MGDRDVGPENTSPSDGAAADGILRAFVEAIPTPTLVCDPETLAIRAANPPAVDLLGHDRGTLTLMGLPDVGETEVTVDGEPIAEVVASAVAADHETAGAEASDTEASAGGVRRFEWDVRLGDPGLRVDAALHTATIAGGEWLVVGLSDATDRVAAATERDGERRLVDALAETVPLALFRCTEEGTLSRWNERLATDSGYDPESLSGRALTSLFDEETRGSVGDALSRVYRDGETVSGEARLLTRSGERLPYRLSIGPVTEGDRVVGAVGVGEDVTDASLREERLAVLTRVLRHNFRNDLNVVTGFTGRAIEAIDDPELAGQLERVVDTAQRLLRLGETSRKVERLLSEHPSPRPLALAPAVDAALESLDPALRERAAVDVDVPADLAVSAVAFLPEAITELVDNAIRHNDADAPRVRISAAELPSETWVSLVVADDGPGIPPAERAVLTGEETPLDHASGLGLWYVNWIVTAGGGSLDIAESKAGGSRIELSLRAAEGSPPDGTDLFVSGETEPFDPDDAGLFDPDDAEPFGSDESGGGR
ncbi:PAS domain-containing sensor histidine kinase [Halorubrum sp. GN11_10-6_MGM]|uniref:PAS domain-containing sensor histidine kinase n=1 Tax=Halorubrum sp. GN11_10-6_MGM TaxID=2518112 RepID=UPI0010F67E61|nr:PAS domain-containing sensor histidine kinase [Halorubrum sp. GN11_10-6_MGM]TKX75655.1 PAS domain-containing sensor histidine kinase [Halorubrum sp. GN11_10-6_MGM]